MKELTVEEMERIEGGNGWCKAAGFVAALAVAGGPIGWAMFGPPAFALGAACLFAS